MVTTETTGDCWKWNGKLYNEECQHSEVININHTHNGITLKDVWHNEVQVFNWDMQWCCLSVKKHMYRIHCFFSTSTTVFDQLHQTQGDQQQWNRSWWQVPGRVKACTAVGVVADDLTRYGAVRGIFLITHSNGACADECSDKDITLTTRTAVSDAVDFIHAGTLVAGCLNRAACWNITCNISEYFLQCLNYSAEVPLFVQPTHKFQEKCGQVHFENKLNNSFSVPQLRSRSPLICFEGSMGAQTHFSSPSYLSLIIQSVFFSNNIGCSYSN